MKIVFWIKDVLAVSNRRGRQQIRIQNRYTNSVDIVRFAELLK